MTKIISGNIIIGNLILEAVENDIHNLSFDKIIYFDELLTEHLKELNFSTKFSFNEIINFKDNYPFIVEDTDENYLIIPYNNITKKKLIIKLERYFRLGMPNSVIEMIKTISKKVLI